MQELPKTTQKLSKIPLSPIPLRTNYFYLYKKNNYVSKSIESKEKKSDLSFLSGCKNKLVFSSQTFYFTKFKKVLIFFFIKRSSSHDSEEKNMLYIEEKDLNGLISLRKDSQNPQEKDACFRNINFDEIDDISLNVGYDFVN